MNEQPWAQKPQGNIPEHLKQLEQEAQTWRAPEQLPPQQGAPGSWVMGPNGPVQIPFQRPQAPPGWQMGPNGQWVPVQGPPQVQQPPMYQNPQFGPAPQQQMPPQYWQQPNYGPQHAPQGQYPGPMSQQPVAQQRPPMQGPPQAQGQRLPPPGVPPKEGKVPAVKKMRRAIYLATTVAVLSLLLAIGAAIYFVMNY